jgi:hypothetical protein
VPQPRGQQKAHRDARLARVRGEPLLLKCGCISDEVLLAPQSCQPQRASRMRPFNKEPLIARTIKQKVPKGKCLDAVQARALTVSTRDQSRVRGPIC